MRKSKSIYFVDHKKLPFMAMLRNLRNLIKAGISQKHHQQILRRLTDEVLSASGFKLRLIVLRN